MSSFSRRPRFQLSLRSLFVLFLLACVLIGLAIKWRQRALTQQEVVRLLRVESGVVFVSKATARILPGVQCIYDYQQTDDLIQSRLFSPKPSWLSSIFGIDMIHCIKECKFSRLAGVNDFELIGRLGYVTHLELLDGVEEFGDWERLSSLSKLTNLTVLTRNTLDVSGQSLDVSGKRRDPQTGNRFEHFHKLNRLNDLHLIEPDLNEAELISILHHPGLEILRLSEFQGQIPILVPADSTAIRIKQLYLANCSASEQGIVSLVSKMPQLKFLAIEMGIFNFFHLSEQVFESISRLEKLEQLFLHGTSVDGREIHRLEKLPIKELGLGYSNLDDRGLENLVGFKQLNYLEVGSTKITDQGMKSLARLPKLEYLSIRDTKVSDEGFLELAKTKGLKTIRIRDTLITDEGVQQFRKQLPECAVDVR